MIVFRDVSFTYPGAQRPALRRISLRFEAGQRVAIVGANGSGKSTLARLANGLLVPCEGSVLVDGMDTADESRTFDIRSRVGLVLQNPDNQIVGTVVEEDVAFGPENLGVPRDELRARVDAAIAAVGLTGMERKEPHLLSEGQKQRLAIAGALAMDPAYLVLDEPTAMLDAAGRHAILEVLERLVTDGHGIVHITHDMAETIPADRVIALDDGKVAFDGPVAELLSNTHLLLRLGLEQPPMVVMAAVVRANGLEVPLAPAPEELVEALWRS
ncbi:MAG: energy-coupling factor transporter ATPase [Coriobacteriales bacterium]|nr:energy-coupling factor transporter ATPase [Actinomycetes bacterium]